MDKRLREKIARKGKRTSSENQKRRIIKEELERIFTPEEIRKYKYMGKLHSRNKYYQKKLELEKGFISKMEAARGGYLDVFSPRRQVEGRTYTQSKKGNYTPPSPYPAPKTFQSMEDFWKNPNSFGHNKLDNRFWNDGSETPPKPIAKPKTVTKPTSSRTLANPAPVCFFTKNKQKIEFKARYSKNGWCKNPTV